MSFVSVNVSILKVLVLIVVVTTMDYLMNTLSQMK